jgi:chloride channel 7
MITEEVLTETSYSLVMPWLFWVGSSLIFAFIAVMLTVYWAPYAAGSGVPEVMGMLNGVNGGGATYVSTLITKAAGVSCAVLGNLAVGKEGPLVHIGAICGLLGPYMPFDILKCFHNDSDKRTFMSAGCSAGVAAAFGAPIGGTLFTYEISKPTTFWTFSMLWRVFFTAAVSVFTLGILQSLKSGAVLSLSNSATLKFGEVLIIYSPISDALVAVILGVICGLLGALFVSVNSMMIIFRKKYVNTNIKKVIEVLLFSFVTSSTFYWLSYSNA